MQSDILETHIFLVFVLGSTPQHTCQIHRCPIKISNRSRHPLQVTSSQTEITTIISTWAYSPISWKHTSFWHLFLEAHHNIPTKYTCVRLRWITEVDTPSKSRPPKRANNDHLIVSTPSDLLETHAFLTFVLEDTPTTYHPNTHVSD